MRKVGFHKSLLAAAVFMATAALAGCNSTAATTATTEGQMMQIDGMNVTTAWDKTFAQSDKVEHQKVVFHNRYGIKLVGDLYLPKDRDPNAKLAAIAVSGPFGAVKEQASGLYAQHLAENGFIAIAFDPSFTGESGGQARYVASPDISTEDFSAAVDYLLNRNDVDPEAVGILGICGWGGFAINAAAYDTRIKATVASTMYDISRNTANGYFDANDNEQSRFERKTAINQQRTLDYNAPEPKLGGGVVDPLPADAPQFVKDYYDYYKTERGYHPRSLNSNNGWTVASPLSFMNAPILAYSDEIRSAVMVVHGDKAHSFYMGKDAFAKLKGDNKEFVVVKGANHTDLYDQMDKIPFDKIIAFFHKNLK